MALFMPKRLIIKPQSKHSPITKEIIERARRFDPSVSIESLNTKDFKYPVETPREKFEYMKESAIITERVEPFIKTFDSPGNIVESLTTVLNLTWMCASRCEFCYLQTVQTPEHYFYTNLRDAEHEIASSGVAHTAILTLWTHLSVYFGQRLLKLPDRFKETSDWLREHFVAARVRQEREAIDRYFGLQRKLIEQLNEKNKTYKVDDRFRKDRATIAGWYKANSRYPLRLTASEFNDFLAVDHLTGNGDFLMQMAEKYSHFTFTIRSRSSYVDNFLKHDGLGRATFHMVMSPDQGIKDFEHGTSSLDERIHAVKRIQEAKGFPLNIVFEPIITYPGYMEDYKALIGRLHKELDPTRIGKFILGSMRFNNQLRAMIQLHFPNTHLFDEQYHYVPPQDPDTKSRYLVDTRKSIYTAFSAEIQTSLQKPIVLGSETPEMWERMQLDQNGELANAVHEPLSDNGGTGLMPNQNTPVNTTPPPDTSGAPDDAHVNDGGATSTALPTSEADEVGSDPSVKPIWTSLSPQDIRQVIDIRSRCEEDIEIGRLEDVARRLKQMHVREDQGSLTAQGIPQKTISNKWTSISARTIEDLEKQSVLYSPVKIIGTMSDVSEFVPHETSAHGLSGFRVVTISDTRGSKIRSLEIEGSRIQDNLNHHREKNTRCTFFGAIVTIKGPRGKWSYRFFLHDFIADIDPVDLVALDAAANRRRLLEQYTSRSGVQIYQEQLLRSVQKRKNGVIWFIVSRLSKELGIEGLDSAPHLARALEFVALQAFSHGRHEILEKLHGLVIGPPNSGKSYLTRAALILNPIAQEISSSSNKITEAGLVGAVRSSGKRTRSEPGILPLNHGGVVCIQEFHDIRGKRRDAVCGILVRMMEEGRVIDSTSANTFHLSETGVLLDMNRYSQIDPAGHYNAFTDINIPVNLLARFDYIVEIPRDKARSEQIARQMTRGFKTMGKKRGENGPDLWEHQLRLLVANLKSRYRVVEFPENLQTLVHERVSEILATVPPELSNQVEDMRLRIVRSVFKLAKAAATSNSRDIASTEDVEYVLKFVKDKVAFMKRVHSQGLQGTRPDIGDVQRRQKFIETRFRGEKFSIDDVKQYLSTVMDGECDNRTIQRDLGGLGAKPQQKPKGTWSLK